LGYAAYARYERTGSNADTPVNHATTLTHARKAVTNLLTDGSAELGSAVWVTGNEPYNGTVKAGTFTRDQTTRKYGLVSWKIGIGASGKSIVKQTVNLTGDRGYTLSAWIKSDGPKAYLRVKYTAGGATHEAQSDPAHVEGTAGAYRRYAVSVTIPAGVSTAECALVCEGTSGSGWFDGIQLEEGLTLNTKRL
jgi:hypothetical protein